MTIDGETIETTKEHQFWVEGQGWTKAKFLKAGDQLRDDDGNSVIINKVEIVSLPKNQYTIVYNFEVADFHTYYVADSYVLVHNNCIEKIAEKITKKGKNKINYLADDMSNAKNYARKNIVGHNTEKMFGFPKGKEKSKNAVWQGWKNLDNGNTAYWNHDDWMKGDGLCKFPHINFSMDGGNTVGHIFLKDKIIKKGMWDDFVKEIKEWSE